MAQHDRLILQVILGDGVTFTPTALDVRSGSWRGNLLAMAIKTTVGTVNLLALIRQARTSRRIELVSLGWHGSLASKLQLWGQNQTTPRSSHGKENAQEQKWAVVHRVAPADKGFMSGATKSSD
jgi:hypothetical protein